jgi:signal transduction histidine kinase
VPASTTSVWAVYLASGLALAIILVALVAAMVLYQRRYVALHRQYSKQLLSAQEEERAWVAREVHDDALQRVAMLAHELHETAEEPPSTPDRQRQRMEAIVAEVEDLGVMLRRVAHRLHPSLIDQAGLVPALQGLASDVARASGLVVELELPANGKTPVVPRDTALILYRIAQEALRNVVRHSGAKQATLQLAMRERELELSISDRGKGFAVDRSNPKGKGLGMVSMAERARLADGRFEVWSEPGRGTTLRALVPIYDN